MTFLDKIKQLFKKPAPVATLDDNIHRHAVSARIMAWLDQQGWRYEHHAPNDDSDNRTHHLILSFTDRQSEWTCVFRINETNQLIAIFGILTNTIPPSHYASVLIKIAQANLSIGFGSIELDPYDGEMRAKICIDAEFGTLTDRALGCYLQGLAGLVEVAQGLFDAVMAEPVPSAVIDDYLPTGEHMTDDEMVLGDGRKFFLPTVITQ